MCFGLPNMSMAKYYQRPSGAEVQAKALECFNDCKTKVSPYMKGLKVVSIAYAVAGKSKNRRIAVVIQCIDSLYDLMNL